MPIKVKLDASKVVQSYSAALRRLSSLTGFDQRAVLLGEAGIILKTWAGRTKVASPKKSDLRSRLTTLRDQALTQAHERGDITINAGLRGPEGRVWRRTGTGKFFLVAKLGTNGRGIDWTAQGESARKRRGYWANVPSVVNRVNRYSNDLPGAIDRGRRAAGLARQSVVQIADQLGIDMETVQGGGALSSSAISGARNSAASNGTRYQNGTGTIAGNNSKTVVTLINTLPYGAKIGMDRTLLGVLNGRAKYFEQSYAKGAFQTIGKTAMAYPWMRVTKPVGA